MASGLTSNRRPRSQRLSRRVMQPPQAPIGTSWAQIVEISVDGNTATLIMDRPVVLTSQPVLSDDPITDSVGLPELEATTVVATQPTDTNILLTFDVALAAATFMVIGQPCNWIRTSSGGHAAATYAVIG